MIMQRKNLLDLWESNTVRPQMCVLLKQVPFKKQNHDCAIYLLIVLYQESWKTEEWEKNKTEVDTEEYIWKNSSSEKSI